MKPKYKVGDQVIVASREIVQSYSGLGGWMQYTDQLATIVRVKCEGAGENDIVYLIDIDKNAYGWYEAELISATAKKIGMLDG